MYGRKKSGRIENIENVRKIEKDKGLIESQKTPSYYLVSLFRKKKSEKIENIENIRRIEKIYNFFYLVEKENERMKIIIYKNLLIIFSFIFL